MHIYIYVCLFQGYRGVKPGWARINFPYYLSNEDFEFILLALELVASFGQSFLSIYNFNWKTSEWAFSKQKFQEVMHESGVEALSLDDHQNLVEDYDPKRLINGQVLKHKYASYLENARHIANCLPICPKESPIPKDIDSKFLLYRV